MVQFINGLRSGSGWFHIHRQVQGCSNLRGWVSNNFVGSHCSATKRGLDVGQAETIIEVILTHLFNLDTSSQYPCDLHRMEQTSTWGLDARIVQDVTDFPEGLAFVP